jgi:hypothetical protein
MFEDLKENGNEASHSTSLLDAYITRSVFFAFCSILIWLYKNREEIQSGKMLCYGEQHNSDKDNWTPTEGTVEVIKVDQQNYFYCGKVHLGDKNKTPEPGRRIRIKSINQLENEPRVLNVTLFSSDWEYTDLP